MLAAARPGPLPPPGGAVSEAPARFSVQLDTSQGAIVLDLERDLAPRGVDRFHHLVRAGFFTDVCFFRVVAGFVAQAGLHGDPSISRAWRDARFPDDPVKLSNRRGTLSFATSGPNARSTQFFINLKDNARLDAMGFAPLGRARSLDVVERLFSGYGEGPPGGSGPQQSRIQREGNAYLRASFPKLDFIEQARVIDA